MGNCFHYARGHSKFDNQPLAKEAADFAAFADGVLSDRSSTKGKVYICAPMTGDGRRCKENAAPRCWLPFDLDGIADREAFRELLLWFQRFQGFAYTTSSHTPDSPRCRVVLELSRPLDRTDGTRLGKAIEAAIVAKLGEGHLVFDGSVYRAEQPIYTPLIGATEYRFDGEAVDIDAWLEHAPEAAPEQPGATERQALIQLADPVVSALKSRGMIKRDIGGGKLAVVCPCAGSHTSESGVTSTVYMLPHFGGVRYGKFHCLHQHCNGRPQEQFLEALGLNPALVWQEQAKGAVDFGLNGERTEESTSVQTSAKKPETSGPFLNLSDWIVSHRFTGQAPERQWLISGVLPLGKPALLAAAGGVGKSFLLLELAHKVAAFRELGGNMLHDPGHFTAFGKLQTGGAAVLICAEDDAIEVHNRLSALGGPAERLIVVPLPDAGGVRPLFTLDDRGRSPTTTEHFRQLANQLKAISGLALVAFDPLQALCGGLDLNLPQHAQHVCGELAMLASETGAAVIVSHHFRKTSDIATPEQAREAVRGSGGLVDGVRSVVAVWPVREDTGKTVCQRLIVPWQRGRVVHAAVVKANFRPDLAVKTLVRDDHGLLRDRSFDLGQVTPKRDELTEALIKGIVQAALANKPFTKTGINGIYSRRHQLSTVFQSKSRAVLEGLVQELLNCGRLETFRTKPSQPSPSWLDVPGGVLSKLPGNGWEHPINDGPESAEEGAFSVEVAHG